MWLETPSDWIVDRCGYSLSEFYVGVQDVSTILLVVIFATIHRKFQDAPRFWSFSAVEIEDSVEQMSTTLSETVMSNFTKDGRHLCFCWQFFKVFQIIF